MRFDYSQPSQPGYIAADFDKRYGETLPTLQSKGNLTYRQFIDVLEYFWKLGHPDISFGPFGRQSIFDPELGYIIYQLDSKTPSENNPKPKLHEYKSAGADTTAIIWLESFNTFVKFTAIHKNPVIADQIADEFEQFMLEMVPVVKMLGAENVRYARRLSDSHETRYGDDLSSRSIIYMIVLQKILIEEISKLQQVYIQAQAIINNDATPTYTGATPAHVVFTSVLDNHMSGQ